MNNWFTVKVKFTKQLENGAFKRVTEPYLLASVNFSDAETRIYEELGSIIRGQFSVVDIRPSVIEDIFSYDDCGVYYKASVSYESATEGEKSKSVKKDYLVEANSVKEAYERLKECLTGLLVDYSITKIEVSPIVDIFPYREQLDKEIGRSDDEYVLKADGSPAVKGKTYQEGELILKSEYENIQNK